MRLPVLFLALCGASWTTAASKSEQDVLTYIRGEFENTASQFCNKIMRTSWDAATDLSDSDKYERMLNATMEAAEFQMQTWDNWFQYPDWKNYQNKDLKRQMKFLSQVGASKLPKDELEKFNKLVTSMIGIYGSARICPYDNQQCNIETEGMRLEPDIENVMARSRDYNELEYVWTQWRLVSGAPIRDSYANYVTFSNEAAKLNGYDDLGKMWNAEYETDNFESDVMRLWSQVEPLYKKLHSYTYSKLKEIYPQHVPEGGYIPAHLLGNMWSQTWDNLYDLLEPFPEATKVNITKSMIEKGYDVLKMFNVANEFYTSLGLESMEMAYGDLAVIEQPSNRDIVCHASAWDFCDRQDFRIKMCTSIDEEDFTTVHHELGHVQYYLQYKNQPITFRKGANPGFHEAIGDVIALSASTPQHYQSLGLISDYKDTYENSINTLLRSALHKIAFLPFSIVIDAWRWEVFGGKTPESEWNQRWWELRRQYQMVDAPNKRTEEHFDAGSKYHVAANAQYISYFVAHILQFQIHRALCIEAGQYDPQNPTKKPLHSCDIYQSTAAGAKLKEALRVGGSVHWSEVLKKLTNESELNAQALLEYYAPLSTYLSSKEQVDQTVPIVVGAILGAVVVCALTAYFVKQYLDYKKNKLAEHLAHVETGSRRSSDATQK